MNLVSIARRHFNRKSIERDIKYYDTYFCSNVRETMYHINKMRDKDRKDFINRIKLIISNYESIKKLYKDGKIDSHQMFENYNNFDEELKAMKNKAIEDFETRLKRAKERYDSEHRDKFRPSLTGPPKVKILVRKS